MNLHPGLSFKLIREEQELSQSFISKVIGVSRSTIDRFEKGKIELSEDLLLKLQELLKIKQKFNLNIDANLENKFVEILDSIFYQDHKYVQLFNNLRVDSEYLSSTIYYPLIYVFDYCITIQQNNSYRLISEIKVCKKLNQLEKTLDNFTPYLPDEVLGIYLNYKSERLRLKTQYLDAISLITQAEKVVVNEKHRALIYYRKAISLARTNQNSLAIIWLDKAKVIFDSYLNFDRSLDAEFLKAMIYDNMGDYRLAIETYKRCLQAVKRSNLRLSKEVIINNLAWANMMNKDYDETIKWSKMLLKMQDKYNSGYFYLIWCYYCLGNISEAKHYLGIAQRTKLVGNDPAEDQYIVLLQHFLNADEKAVETFTNREDEWFISSSDTLKMIYTMLIEFYKKNELNEKMTLYETKLYKLGS